MELNGPKVHLSKGQIDYVREIGFGGMLDIEITKYPPWILAYLVSNFNPNSWVQRITNGIISLLLMLMIFLACLLFLAN